jgi:hypothetical protein
LRQPRRCPCALHPRLPLRPGPPLGPPCRSSGRRQGYLWSTVGETVRHVHNLSASVPHVYELRQDDPARLPCLACLRRGALHPGTHLAEQVPYLSICRSQSLTRSLSTSAPSLPLSRHSLPPSLPFCLSPSGSIPTFHALSCPLPLSHPPSKKGNQGGGEGGRQREITVNSYRTSSSESSQSGCLIYPWSITLHRSITGQSQSTGQSLVNCSPPRLECNDRS